MSLRDRLDALRADAHRAIDRMPGKAGELARKANAALGRPLADAAELADCRAFEARATAPSSAAAPAPAARARHEAAPVVVYHMDKTRRDATRLTEVLEGCIPTR